MTRSPAGLTCHPGSIVYAVHFSLAISGFASKERAGDAKRKTFTWEDK